MGNATGCCSTRSSVIVPKSSRDETPISLPTLRGSAVGTEPHLSPEAGM
jgi:hypothetical protein